MTAPPVPRIRRWLLALWPWAAALVSGLLHAWTLPPWNHEWLGWIALAPLLAALWIGGATGGPHPRPFVLGWVAGITHFLITFHWITEVSTIGWVALTPYLALFPALWAWFCGRVAVPGLPRSATPTRAPADEVGSGDRRTSPPAPEPLLLGLPFFGRSRTPPAFPPSAWMSSRRNLGFALLAAAAWVAQEWLRSVLFTGFGWNALGVALQNNLAFLQMASVTGADGLSFLLVFSAAIAVLTVRRLWDEIGRVALRPHYDFNLAMALVVAVFAFGVQRLQRPPADERELEALLVQPAIPQNQKWDPAFDQEILDRLDLLSAPAETSRPDLVIWPEAATPRPALLDAEILAWIDGIRERTGSDLLLGSIDGDERGDYNAAILLAEGRPPETYRKVHLVPFGEYIPFRHSFPLFAWIAGDLVPGDFAPGEGPVVFRATKSGARFGPLICFEDTLPELTRTFVRAGAEFLVNITNDGWFGRSPAAEQHLANARFRAVENARPLVRCANTGVSCVIDSRGRIRQALRDAKGSPFVSGSLAVVIPVPVVPESTFFSRHGRVFALACCGLSGAALLAYGVRLRQRRTTQG